MGTSTETMYTSDWHTRHGSGSSTGLPRRSATLNPRRKGFGLGGRFGLVGLERGRDDEQRHPLMSVQSDRERVRVVDCTDRSISEHVYHRTPGWQMF